jgi:hypothetical protein
MILRTRRKMLNLREDLTELCGTLLLGYRRNCAAATRVTQVMVHLDLMAPLYSQKLSVNLTRGFQSSPILHSLTTKK